MNGILTTSAMKILGVCVLGAALLTACGSDESPSSDGPETEVETAEESDRGETEVTAETTTTTRGPSARCRATRAATASMRSRLPTLVPPYL